MIKNKVHALVEEYHIKDSILKLLNTTFLTPIPKTEGVDYPNKFRPIALCNIIYKIISKVLANIIKSILPLLISPHQLGYVEGRKILYNIILMQEVIHSLKA